MNEARNLDADDFWDATDPKPAIYRDWAVVFTILAIAVLALHGLIVLVTGVQYATSGVVFIMNACAAVCMWTISKLTGEK